MIITDKIASKATLFIKATLNYPDKQLEIIEYGLKVVISTAIKFLLVFIAAFYLGIFKYTLIAVASFVSIRSFVHGAHANHSLSCIICNFIFFLGNVYLSINFQVNLLSLCFIFFISLLLVIKYAPADTAATPLPSKKLRRKLKISSILVVIFSFLFCLFIQNLIIKTIITCSIFEGTICITPIFYKLFGNSYRNYINIT